MNSRPTDFAGAARRIADEGPWREAAAQLGCELAAIRAVAEVESRGEPFLDDGRPPILFERHVFSRLTGGRFDEQYPSISNPEPGGYGPGGAAQYDRLLDAIELSARAALESASWGRFQIMGFNFRACGYGAVEPFVNAMCGSEAAQLSAFVSFVRFHGLDAFLRTRNWPAFAEGYNGPAYGRNRYDERMAAAYAKHAGQSAPEAGEEAPDQREALRDMQDALRRLGKDPGPSDGIWGRRTEAAVRALLLDPPKRQETRT